MWTHLIAFAAGVVVTLVVAHFFTFRSPIGRKMN